MELGYRKRILPKACLEIKTMIALASLDDHNNNFEKLFIAAVQNYRLKYVAELVDGKRYWLKRDPVGTTYNLSGSDNIVLF